MKLYCKLRLNRVVEINARIFNCGNYFGFTAIPQQQVFQISMTERCLSVELPKLTMQPTAAMQCLKLRDFSLTLTSSEQILISTRS